MKSCMIFTEKFGYLYNDKHTYLDFSNLFLLMVGQHEIIIDSPETSDILLHVCVCLFCF